MAPTTSSISGLSDHRVPRSLRFTLHRSERIPAPAVLIGRTAADDFGKSGCRQRGIARRLAEGYAAERRRKSCRVVLSPSMSAPSWFPISRAYIAENSSEWTLFGTYEAQGAEPERFNPLLLLAPRAGLEPAT